MATTQSTFERFERDRTFPGVRPGEWGPTMRRPVPEADAERSALEAWLHARGFNLACIREADGIIPSLHTDYHPDDEHREDHPADEEAAIAADLDQVQADAA